MCGQQHPHPTPTSVTAPTPHPAPHPPRHPPAQLYFKLNQLRQCKFLIGPVEGPGFPPLDAPAPSPTARPGAGFASFPRSQLVTYRYYAGLLAMYDENWGRANECLTYALRACHAGYPRNRALILGALVPVRVFLGELPSHALLQRHGLQRYAGVVEGVRRGDVAAFNGALEAHREEFIASGVYLLLQRLQLHAYRTLFRRVVRLVGSRAPLSALQAGLAASGVSMDLPEVECVVANLIHGKYVRGYLSHRPPVLVTAKDNAFQALAKVAAAGGSGGA